MKTFRSWALALALFGMPGLLSAQTQPVPTAIGSDGRLKDVVPSAIMIAPAGGGAGKGKVVAADQGFPVSCLSGCSSPVPFVPTGAALLSVTTSTARVALPTSDATVLLTNNGAVDLNFKLGNGSVTAATTDFLLPAGRSIVVGAGSNVDVAAITASGSTSLSITTGTGSPTISGGGGGSGGGGAITAAATSFATGFSADLGKIGDSACSTDNGAACDLIQLVMRTNQRTTSLIAAIGAPAVLAGVDGSTAATLANPVPTTAGLVAGSALVGSVKLSDGTNLATVKAASTLAVTTDTAAVVAQRPDPVVVCPNIIPINQTTSTDLHTYTNTGYICAIVIENATATQAWSLVEGTGTLCATGIAAEIGGTTASTQGSMVQGNSSVVSFKMQASAKHQCLLQGGSTNISGYLTYVDR